MALIWDSNKNAYVGTFVVGATGVSQTETFNLGNITGNVTVELEGLDPQLVEQSDSITVIDCTPAPHQYLLSSDVSITNEGQTINITLTDAPIGKHYFNITGNDITVDDISGDPAKYGNLAGFFDVTVDGGSDTQSINILNDKLTENTEVLIFTLRDVENRVVSVPIYDTSKSPTYILTSDFAEVVEGNPVTVTLQAEPGIYGYSITGQNIDSADIHEALTGEFIIDSGGTSSVVLNLEYNNDSSLEPFETFNISLDNGESDINIKILEPTFTLSAIPHIVDEGADVTFTLTTNAPSGQYSYTILDDAHLTENDIHQGLTGTFNVDSTGKGHVTLNILSDTADECPEILTLKLDNEKAEMSVTLRDVSN